VTAPSLIAFALVFLATSVLTSLLLGVIVRLSSRRLRSLGARAERRAAALMLVAPPVLASLLTGLLAVNSARSLLAGTDHCADHSHHLHICLVHGAEWAIRPWAVELLALVGCFVLVRLFQLSWAHLVAQRAAKRFFRVGDPLPGHGRVVLVPFDEPTVFTAGALSPTVVISRGAWSRLNADERRAVLEHELAHVEGGDIWRRAVLALLACFTVPGFASYALRLWDRSAERICDRRAAEVVGRPSIVAGAIVSLARGMVRGQVPAGAVFAAACHVTDRVHSLLDGEPDGALGAVRLSWWVLGVGVGIALAAATLSEQLHHILETILG
jgi:Zn-dependent protease with chaperone function